MINSVVLVGRLTRDVDLRYTTGGTAVANFSVAVDRNYRTAQGERQTDFINCVMWRASAENFAKFTRKGSLVGIEGSIQTRSYDNNQGQKVYVTEVLANNFSLLEPKSVTDSRPEGQTSNDGSTNNFGGYNSQSAPSNNNFGGNNPFPSQSGFGGQNNFSGNDPFASSNSYSSDDNNDETNISDDDLPF